MQIDWKELDWILESRTDRSPTNNKHRNNYYTKYNSHGSPIYARRVPILAYMYCIIWFLSRLLIKSIQRQLIVSFPLVVQRHVLTRWFLHAVRLVGRCVKNLCLYTTRTNPRTHRQKVHRGDTYAKWKEAKRGERKKKEKRGRLFSTMVPQGRKEGRREGEFLTVSCTQLRPDAAPTPG